MKLTVLKFTEGHLLMFCVAWGGSLLGSWRARSSQVGKGLELSKGLVGETAARARSSTRDLPWYGFMRTALDCDRGLGSGECAGSGESVSDLENFARRPRSHKLIFLM